MAVSDDEPEYSEFLYSDTVGGFVLMLSGDREAIREVVNDVPDRGKTPEVMFREFLHESDERDNFNAEVWNDDGLRYRRGENEWAQNGDE